MRKLRPPWPSFTQIFVFLTILTQISTITSHYANKDVEKLNEFLINSTRTVTEVIASGNNNEETAITTLPSINNNNKVDVEKNNARSINHRNQHHHRKIKINDNHDKRRKRKKVHQESLLKHQHANSHKNQKISNIKPKKNSARKSEDDLVTLTDEIDELDFNNGTILQTNIRRKKDGYYITRPDGVVVYRRYKCVPKSNYNPQPLTQPRPSYSSQYPYYGNQKWRKYGM